MLRIFLGSCSPTFRDSLLAPLSRIKQSKSNAGNWIPQKVSKNP
jgi:hypothetical protein